jgi:protein-S-isoprenylcysteine O-methyltransferase Ste14
VNADSLFVKFLFDTAAEVAILAVVVGWLCFAVIVVIGKKHQASGHAKQNIKSRLGFFLQIVACAICFAMPRIFFSPFLPMSKTSEELLAALIVALAAASVWFCYAAARTLGKQWALDARVIEGHELIIEGPFAIVRNPIYLAMFGMTIATYLAVSRWHAIVFALIFFAAGTAIRIRTEEKLLREIFGAQFEDYARHVPAFFPRFLH